MNVKNVGKLQYVRFHPLKKSTDAKNRVVFERVNENGQPVRSTRYLPPRAAHLLLRSLITRHRARCYPCTLFDGSKYIDCRLPGWK